jgi:phosphoadenosine phosphosulfate reductase
MDAIQLAAHNLELEGQYPQTILKWALKTFGQRLAIVTSFQPTGIVTLHMLEEIGVQVDVLTLDTGLLFPESYTLMDEVEARFSHRFKRIRAEHTVEEQGLRYGPELWARQPDFCCHMRKVVPLGKALEGYQAWVTGIRRDQGPTRAQTPILAWDNRHQQVKIAPLAEWTEEMLWTYIEAYELPYNRLHDQGYPSIGCVPCTQAVDPASNDSRAGRWAGRAKTECGIHINQLA